MSYFPEGTRHFDDYVEAVEWAQAFAMENRRLMMEAVVQRRPATWTSCRPFDASLMAVNCHHNYVAREHHYGKNVF